MRAERIGSKRKRIKEVEDGRENSDKVIEMKLATFAGAVISC